VTLTTAPLFHDVADGPDGGAAYWLLCADGVRIRVAVWGAETAKHGTVLLFPGRTEYIEKYGRTAAEFARRGYATLVIDWRGQGLSDRLLKDEMLGHVGDFQDYQLDVQAVLAFARKLELPTPHTLFAHSMGGCIGLRALIDGLPVTSAVFSGPMWGIALTTSKRSLGWTASTVAHTFGFGNMLAPGMLRETYVLANPFENNMLTTDLEMFEYMKQQVSAHPELALGGPTLSWLNKALRECRALRAHPTPNVPCITYVGTNERIVDIPTIHDRMSRWPNGELVIIERGEHEIIMEGPAARTRVFDEACALFARHATLETA
jgi:lysophospholipase